MIEEYNLKFALFGSSARKVKQGQANLIDTSRLTEDGIEIF